MWNITNRAIAQGPHFRGAAPLDLCKLHFVHTWLPLWWPGRARQPRVGTGFEVPLPQSRVRTTRGAHCRSPVWCGFTDGEKDSPGICPPHLMPPPQPSTGFDSANRGRSPSSVFPETPPCTPAVPASAGWLSHARQDHCDPHGELPEETCESESRGPDTGHINELGDWGTSLSWEKHRPELRTAPVLLSPSAQVEASLGQFPRLTTGPRPRSSRPRLQSSSPG